MIPSERLDSTELPYISSDDGVPTPVTEPSPAKSSRQPPEKDARARNPEMERWLDVYGGAFEEDNMMGAE